MGGEDGGFWTCGASRDSGLSHEASNSTSSPVCPPALATFSGMRRGYLQGECAWLRAQLVQKVGRGKSKRGTMSSHM